MSVGLIFQKPYFVGNPTENWDKTVFSEVTESIIFRRLGVWQLVVIKRKRIFLFLPIAERRGFWNMNLCRNRYSAERASFCQKSVFLPKRVSFCKLLVSICVVEGQRMLQKQPSFRQNIFLQMYRKTVGKPKVFLPKFLPKFSADRMSFGSFVWSLHYIAPATVCI